MKQNSSSNDNQNMLYSFVGMEATQYALHSATLLCRQHKHLKTTKQKQHRTNNQWMQQKQNAEPHPFYYNLLHLQIVVVN